MHQIKNILPGTAKNIIAQLIEPHIIEISVSKHYYGGNATRVSLRWEENLQDLKVIGSHEQGDYTVHRAYVEHTLDYTQPHMILVNNGLSAPLNVDWATKFTDFDERFYYEANDLGNTYTQVATTFKVWSPLATSVKVELKHRDIDTTYTMKRSDKGVWSVEVKGDLEGYSYVYLLKISGEWREAADPYAYASTANSERSSIIDLAKVEKDFSREKLPVFKHFNDAVIYELHVRDFSVSETSGIQAKGKFLGVIEKGSKTTKGVATGIDYLKQLGITHVQVLPVYDFGSVDENNQFDYYNWGYDPVQYNVPEGSYATDANDPYSRIVELQQMNKALHQAGLRSIMDVVYNHMFAIEVTSLQKIVPNYYFRFDEDRNRSNGSYCSNDVDSTMRMCRKYIIDSCLRWIKMYGFDGFRFDLMGITDMETMNELRKKLDAIDPSIMIHGEGWHMPTTIDPSIQATMSNAPKMPGIGQFNDRFREAVKGLVTRYTEETHDTYHEHTLKDLLESSMTGSTLDKGTTKRIFGEVAQSLNYVECHDNATLEDYMKYERGIEHSQERYLKAKMAMVLTFIAQGTPFIHAGQEFRRTKQGVENSYKSSDVINQLDWSRRDKYQDYVVFFKSVIALRKAFSHFRLRTVAEVEGCVTFTQIKDNVFVYSIAKDGVQIDAYINATKDNHTLKGLDGAVMLLDSAEEFVAVEGTEAYDTMTLNPYTVSILKSTK